MFDFLYAYNYWALAFLRIVLGLLFIAHGWPKLKDLKTAASNFSAMGFKPGALWGTIAALAEVFGGLALLTGMAAQTAAVILTMELVVIIVWRLGRGDKFVGGYELDLLLLAAMMFLATQDIAASSFGIFI